MNNKQPQPLGNYEEPPPYLSQSQTQESQGTNEQYRTPQAGQGQRKKIRLQLDDEIKPLREIAQGRQVEPQFKDYVGERVPILRYLEKFNGPQGFRFQQQFQKLNIQSYRRVRGDGNCFYTSLGFRMLEIKKEIKKTQTDETFIKPKKLFKLQMGGKSVEKIDLDNIWEYFDSKFEQFDEKLFKAEDNKFYICFQTYIRSLVYESLQNFKQSGQELAWLADTFDNNEILEFEQESPNCTSAIVYFMAHQHNLEITVVQDSLHQTYGEGNQHKIKLLFNPGHYEILY